MQDLMKENLDISGKKLVIMSESQAVVELDYLVLKEQRQAIIDNVEGTLIRQNNMIKKRKGGEDKEEQEGRLTFMITTSTAVQEVCVIGGDRARERA